MKTSEEVIAVATGDARLAYNDLSIYEARAEQAGNVWKVRFVFKKPGMLGGGPSYEIDAHTGEILNGFTISKPFPFYFKNNPIAYFYDNPTTFAFR